MGDRGLLMGDRGLLMGDRGLLMGAPYLIRGNPVSSWIPAPRFRGDKLRGMTHLVGIDVVMYRI